MYKRVLLKLSGEALSNGKDEPFYNEHLDAVASEIKEAVSLGVQVCVVVGGGNIYRGKMGEKMGMDRSTGDYMGMLATVMNALAISNSLNKLNVANVIMTSIAMQGIGEAFSQAKAIEALNNNKVVIFGAGTGHPYFSTDTTSALRALECKCDIILMAKNGVDGIYDSDPKVNKNAEKFDEISYNKIIELNLQVMDQTATSLCKDNNMPLLVFNMNEKGNIIKACKGSINGTIVK